MLREFISNRRFLLLESVICVMIFWLLEEASLFGFVLCVAMARADVGTGSADHVDLISILRFVLLKSIIRLLIVEI